MAYISDRTIEQVKQAIDIVALVGEYVELKRAGSSYKGLCPFHQEKTPSFVVTESRGTFHCFGCHEGGDGIAFIMKKEGLDFPEAVRFLAQKYGIPIEESAGDAGLRKRYETLYQINREAMLFYYRNLLTQSAPQDYLRRRGFRSQIINPFLLGYADGRGDSLYRHLHEKGFADEDLLHLGLISRSNRGTGFYDRFRNRLMFPILSPQKKVVGFGGRVLGKGHPKYLNSPESDLFHKGENLYGVHRLASRGAGERILLVEGYMDVIALHARGIPYALASLGTALTPEQARLVKRYGDQIYLCYDGDAAGIKASRRAIDVFAEQDLVPKLILLPGGQDPDEYTAAEGVEAFQQQMEEAVDPLDFELQLLAAGYDLSEETQQMDFLRAAIEFLADIPEEATRDLYSRKVAERIGVKAESVQTDAARRAEKRRQEREEEAQRKGRSHRAESENSMWEASLEPPPMEEPESFFDDFPAEFEANGSQMGIYGNDESKERLVLEFELLRLCQSDAASWKALAEEAEVWTETPGARTLLQTIGRLRREGIPPEIEWLRAAVTDEAAQQWLNALEEAKRHRPIPQIENFPKMVEELRQRLVQFRRRKRREEIRTLLQEGTDSLDGQRETRAQLLKELQDLDLALKTKEGGAR